jgi:integrase
MPRRRKRYKNVTPFLDRHGKQRWRWRKTGFKQHLFRAPYGSPEFEAEYDACRSQALAVGGNRSAPGSIDDLIARYIKTLVFRGAGSVTQHSNRLILDRFQAKHGKKPVALITKHHIEAILTDTLPKRREGKRTVGGPEAARKLLKELKKLFDCAVDAEMIDKNPAARVKLPKSKSKGHHTWTEEEIAQYQRRHALGSKARLALEIALWTGQRRGDVYRFGPAHLKSGKIRYEQEKGGKSLWLPAAPQMLAAIEAMPSVGIAAFIVTEHGKPFSKAGFGNKFRDWCDQAGLPHCTLHGLRKAITRRMAEAGKTNQQMKAVGGWSNDRLVGLYARDAEQAKLAEDTLVDLANRFGNPRIND